MFIVKHRNVFFAISALATLAAVVSIAVFGLKLGLDFTGGTLIHATSPGGRRAPGTRPP